MMKQEYDIQKTFNCDSIKNNYKYALDMYKDAVDSDCDEILWDTNKNSYTVIFYFIGLLYYKTWERVGSTWKSNKETWSRTMSEYDFADFKTIYRRTQSVNKIASIISNYEMLEL